MKAQLFKLTVFTRKINRQHVQFAFALLTLVLFVLGSAAPYESIIGPR